MCLLGTRETCIHLNPHVRMCVHVISVVMWTACAVIEYDALRDMILSITVKRNPLGKLFTKSCLCCVLPCPWNFLTSVPLYCHKILFFNSKSHMAQNILSWFFLPLLLYEKNTKCKVYHLYHFKVYSLGLLSIVMLLCRRFVEFFYFELSYSIPIK